VRELIHIDLFAGASGFSTGLRPCGYRTAVAVEMWRPAAASFRLNHPNVPVIERDIRTVTGGEVAAHLPMDGGRRREADLVTAGCPCPTFSRAGKGTHRQFDHRQTLFAEVVRIARAARARVICLENVRGILDKELSPSDPTPVAEIIPRTANAGFFWPVATPACPCGCPGRPDSG
jgi:DNA (cytosine-5)-methyltransferase 1